MRCEYVLTDSGGVQEEATAPNVRRRAFVLRRSTERPEAVAAGFAEVVGTDPRRALPRIRRFHREGWDPPRRSPYGDGRAARRVADALT
jgi:UDP-N-acetylglucosamine 2-epimerase (non-hydrolysing)